MEALSIMCIRGLEICGTILAGTKTVKSCHAIFHTQGRSCVDNGNELIG